MRPTKTEMEDHFEDERKLAVDMSDADLGKMLLGEVLSDIHQAEGEFACCDEHHEEYARDCGAVREVVYRWLGVKQEWDTP